MKRIAMTGKVYGRLTILQESGTYVFCECSCGNFPWVRRGNVLSKYTQSCGCLRNDRVTEAVGTHGHKPGTGPTRTYRSWLAMKMRCSNPTWHAYARYGGRGITVCPRWVNNFANFLADLGECPEGKELDRIDNNGNYEPLNCRWASHEENIHNRGY